MFLQRPIERLPFVSGKTEIKTKVSSLTLEVIPILRFQTYFILMGSAGYLFQPIVLRVRQTPTQVSINGNDYWPDHIFALIYLGQFAHGICVAFGMTSYDSIYIQLMMALSYRFRTLSEMLTLLDYPGPRDDGKDRRILTNVYKMHLNVLEYASVFLKNFSINSTRAPFQCYRTLSQLLQRLRSSTAGDESLCQLWYHVHPADEWHGLSQRVRYDRIQFTSSNQHWLWSVPANGGGQL